MTAEGTSSKSGGDRLLQTRTTRGKFLKYGAAGAASIAAGGAGLSGGLRRARAETVPVVDPATIKLFIRDGLVRMVDETLVRMWAFSTVPPPPPGDPPTLLVCPPFPQTKFPDGALDILDGDGNLAIDKVRVRSQVSVDSDGWASFFPERVIQVVEGESITLTVTNALKEAHRFRIERLSASGDLELVVDTGQIEPGSTATTIFTAPPAGTYIYQDPGPDGFAGRYRALGLHGVLLSMPARSGPNAWKLTAAGPEFERQYVWHFHDIDPKWQSLAAMGVHPKDFPPFLPRYFTINGRSGVDAVAEGLDEAIRKAVNSDTRPIGVIRRDHHLPGGRPGQLIRLVDTGLAVHSPHIHGNHYDVVAKDGRVLPTFAEATAGPTADIEFQISKDVLRLDPLGRWDVILPFHPPLDSSPPLDETTFTRANYPVCPDGSFEIHFPMHCHAEMSQTAAGGLYPNGQLTDWVMLPAPA